jgi:NhaP-type Na+/H+ or K+/H+ antiporter
MSFDNDLFLHILLPPIIFQAALLIDKQAFRRDLFPILAFAVFGTVLSSIIVGLMTFWLSSLGSGTSLPLLDSLLFGSLISSIDPVVTLSILSSVGVSQTDTLYTLIFGESLLNDGVAIVLFDTMVTHLGDNAVVDKALVHEMVVSFFKVTLGSVGIGVGCGVLCTIYFWALRRKHTAVVETALFFCFALLPFYIADGFGASGTSLLLLLCNSLMLLLRCFFYSSMK